MAARTGSRPTALDLATFLPYRLSALSGLTQRLLEATLSRSGVTIAQFFAQGAGVEISSQFLSALPYLATIVVLVLISRNVTMIRLNSPVSLGRSYRPD